MALIWLVLNDNIMFSWQTGITRLLLGGILFAVPDVRRSFPVLLPTRCFLQLFVPARFRVKNLCKAAGTRFLVKRGDVVTGLFHNVYNLVKRNAVASVGECRV